jgi:hypothetical protein
MALSGALAKERICPSFANILKTNALYAEKIHTPRKQRSYGLSKRRKAPKSSKFPPKSAKKRQIQAPHDRSIAAELSLRYTVRSLNGAGKSLSSVLFEAIWVDAQFAACEQSPNEKTNAQVEDPYGREEALQQDWHRKNQAGPDQDAPHPYVEAAKGET